jgi:hypothetical protein
MWYVSPSDSFQQQLPTTSQFTVWDVVPHQEIYEGRGYRVYTAHSAARGRLVKIKQYEGTRAKEVDLNLHYLVKQLLIHGLQRCIAAAKFSQRVMYGSCFLIHIL